MRALSTLAAAPFVFAGSAHAAFAPALDVELQPSRAGSVPALNAVVSQVPGNTPLRRMALRLPPGFGLNVNWSGVLCDPLPAAASGCTDDSRVGEMHVVTPLGATVSGPVHLGRDGRMAAFITDPSGILDQTVQGAVTPRGDTIDISFEPLPAVPLSGVALRFSRGSRGLLVNPSSCGMGTVLGLFTSHSDELAAASDEVTITGCREDVRVTRARVTRSRFRAVRRFADRSRRGYGTALVWSQSESRGATRVYVQRRTRGRWKRIGSLLSTARRGRNVLRFDGRLRNRPLRAGSYRFVIRPRSSRHTRSVRFRILSERRRR